LAWRSLHEHAREAAGWALGDLLDAPGRYRTFSRKLNGVLLDFSRNRVREETISLLLRLARERDLKDWIQYLFAGAPVNSTEGRAAQHMALRGGIENSVLVDGQDIQTAAADELGRMLGFADAVRSGTYRGYNGKRITDVVNIGIGGSDLGLVMLDQALAHCRDTEIRSHFVSNIDGVQLADRLDRVEVDRCLFIVCSKSFTTLETRLNAESARDWLLDRLPERGIGPHFVAISTNDAAMDQFGIAAQNRFRIWDWVGGRYSLWSAVGLSLAIGIGAARFRELLAGAAELDAHFSTASLEQNLPALLALIGIWNQNFLGVTSHAVLPYDQRLNRFPAFLQQLEMESNGKRVTRDGAAVQWETGTVVWGEPGSNAQHSFFQLLHQGTAEVSVDFIAPAQGSSRFVGQHMQALANMLAQAEAFARGRSEEAVHDELAAAGRAQQDIEALTPHKVHPGNRPSNIILLRKIEPRTMGMLIALYEHKVFVQSVIWGINPFDQWGVELGKSMAVRVADALDSPGTSSELPGLAAAIRAWRQD
jgi:glucose-6-phosphate isomerase